MVALSPPYVRLGFLVLLASVWVACHGNSFTKDSVELHESHPPIGLKRAVWHYGQARISQRSKTKVAKRTQFTVPLLAGMGVGTVFESELSG
jgi:hypothetical protein